ncbi:MAG: UPF0175 family protein [Actinomycetota bacterium]
MKTYKIKLDIPYDLILSMRISEDQILSKIKEEIALSFYSRKYLSFGKARKLLGVTKQDFAYLLKERGIPRHYEKDDLEEDIKFANER